MSLATDPRDELDFSAPCGAVTAVLVIAGLTMSGILIGVVATFRGLRRIAKW